MNAPLIEARHLEFAYGGRPVIRNASLTVAAGEFVGLIGPNGSGKSTLLRLLLGLLTPKAGEIRLGGVPARQVGREEFARAAAFVPQDTRLDFPFPAREIVAMGRTPHLGRFRPETDRDREIIAEAMRLTGTEEFADRPVTQLSGGERQRIHIARAVAQEAKTMLLDEPTASLDLSHQLDALKLLKSLAARGTAVIAAIHDLSLAARFCDRLVTLSAGRVVADGSPETVLTPELVGAAFGLRATIRRDPDSGFPVVIPIETLAATGGTR
jgi:iron complex transport system ATP-binding protein